MFYDQISATGNLLTLHQSKLLSHNALHKETGGAADSWKLFTLNVMEVKEFQEDVRKQKHVSEETLCCHTDSPRVALTL